MRSRSRRPSGITSRRVMPRQTCSSLATPAGDGSAAKCAPLIAPADAPTMKSGRRPTAASARSMPTSTAPRLPPPASTKAVFDAAFTGVGAY
jgi:hypothetical protein